MSSDSPEDLNNVYVKEEPSEADQAALQLEENSEKKQSKSNNIVQSQPDEPQVPQFLLLNGQLHQLINPNAATGSSPANSQNLVAPLLMAGNNNMHAILLQPIQGTPSAGGKRKSSQTKKQTSSPKKPPEDINPVFVKEEPNSDNEMPLSDILPTYKGSQEASNSQGESEVMVQELCPSIFQHCMEDDDNDKTNPAKKQRMDATGIPKRGKKAKKEKKVVVKLEVAELLANGCSGVNLQVLVTHITSEHDAVKFFNYFDIIPKEKVCKESQHPMEIREEIDDGALVWQCTKHSCQKKCSVRKDTWLEGTTFSLQMILLFIYSWAHEYTSIKFCEKELEMPSSTAIFFHNYMRDVCTAAILGNPNKIGGQDKIVEVDETVITYNKNQREIHDASEQFVFGGVCRETKEIFLYAVKERTETTLLDCIKACVAPGTTIIADMGKSYDLSDALDESDYKYLTVNAFGRSFVDPSTGAHTQTIKSLWNNLKLQNQKKCGTHSGMVDSSLFEFVWRRRNKGKDLFEKILQDIAEYQVQ